MENDNERYYLLYKIRNSDSKTLYGSMVSETIYPLSGVIGFAEILAQAQGF